MGTTRYTEQGEGGGRGGEGKGTLVEEIFQLCRLIFHILKDCQQSVRSGNRRRTNEERPLLPLCRPA